MGLDGFVSKPWIVPQSCLFAVESLSRESRFMSLLHLKWSAGMGRKKGMKTMFGWNATKKSAPKRMMEQSGAYGAAATGVMRGLMQGTKVATAIGWRPVEAIAIGDRVLTFDNGLQVVTQVTRVKLWDGQGECPTRYWPLEVPAGALGNIDRMFLLPHQPVMLESDTAEALYGDAFATVPAKALDGVNGITRTPVDAETEVVVLHFEDEQVVFNNSGAMFLCPSSKSMLDVAVTGGKSNYRVLPWAEARRLVDGIEAELSGDAWDTPEVASAA